MPRALLAIPLLLSACGDPDIRACFDDTASAEARLEACTRAHAGGGGPEAGARAAEAAKELGEHRTVVDWLDALRGTEGEGRAALAAASSHWRQGDRSSAEILFEQVLDLPDPDSRPRALARAHYGLFYLAWERSELGAALEHARASTLAAARAGDPDLSSQAAQAEAMLSYDLGDLDGVERAADTAEAALGDDAASDRARFLNFRALAHLDRGRPRLARLALQEALDLATGDEEPRFFRSIHLDLARAALELGELDTAEKHVAAASDHLDPGEAPTTAIRYFHAWLAMEMGEPARALEAVENALDEDTPEDWAWELELIRGRAAEARGEMETAEQAYAAAAKIVEKLRRELGSEELQAWMLEQKRQPFEALFRLHAEAGKTGAALRVAERVRARRGLDTWIEATARAKTSETEDGSFGAERWRALERLLPLLAPDPATTDETKAPAPTDLPSPEGSTTLVYFEAEGELWLTRLGRETIAPRRLGGKELAELRDRWLTDPSEGKLAEMLSGHLLPADLAPPAGSVIEILVDGTWGLLPFAALRRDGRFWVRDFTLILRSQLFAPSEADDPDAGSPPMVLADPADDLPAARAEAAEVAGLLGVEPLLGVDASLEALHRARQAPILHLATHTGVDAAGPWIRLAEGRVRLERLLESRLQPDLLVLASCAAADRRDLGPWGSLAGSLLAGGAEQVLAALWSLDDEAARHHLATFYRHGFSIDGFGIESKSTAMALARMQRQAIDDGRPIRDWAPFVLLARPGH